MHGVTLFCLLCFLLLNIVVYKLGMPEQFYKSLKMRKLPERTGLNLKATYS